MPRIVSFLPAGTEIVHALGAGAELVGRSHECDYPASVTNLPVVSRPALELDDASPEDIDRAVAERMETGASMYEIDEVLLRELRPDVIITQNLCRVCAPSGNELSRAVKDFDVTPEILFLTPRNIAEVEENILSVGKAIGREREADELVRSNRERIARVAEAVADVPRRKVVFLEWTDPLFPIWGRNTSELAKRFIGDGFAARIVCVDTTQLDRSFAGREFDTKLLADLPAVVDPCGERGEFHTFVSGGPGFSSPIPYSVGPTVFRDERFMYCDIE